jgi:predicted DNA-binding protein
VTSVETKPTKAVATRIDVSEAAQLEDALEETDWTKSDFVRRAIQYYIEQNPDDLRAFYAEGSLEQFVTELVE